MMQISDLEHEATDEDDMGYFTDIHRQEEELRKLNEELDLKLEVTTSKADNDIGLPSVELSLPKSEMSNSSLEGFPIENDFEKSATKVDRETISKKASKRQHKTKQKELSSTPRSIVPPTLEASSTDCSTRS